DRGYMAELGDSAGQLHEEVGELARSSGVDVVIAVEPEAHEIAWGAQCRCHQSPLTETVADQAGAIAMLTELLSSGDVVLVKASRYRTWKVADYLRETRISTKEAQA
ncbi:MAG: glutamate ligase domain-containing protein, partial [Stackebrandtia sp.]